MPWILLGLVVAIIAVVTMVRRFAAPPAAETASSAAAADSASPRGLSPDELRAMARRSRGMAPATAANMAEMVEKRKRMAASTEARNRERNAAMANRFSTERPDPAWAGAHERTLAGLSDSGPMRDAGVKARDFSATCKATMCRISADFPNQSDAEDWLQLYMSGVGDNLPVATARKAVNPDGSVQVEIYGLGRK